MRLLRLSEAQVVTVRRFLFEILTIIIGVLIALSFDGVAEWRRERKLVRDAEANLQAELRGNKARTAGWLKSLPARVAEIEHGMAVVEDLITRGKEVTKEEEKLTLQMTVVDLSESGRETAATTGAFGHMKFEEVQRYTSIYGYQRRFVELQDRMFQQLILVLPIWKGRLADLKTEELQAWRQDLMLLRKHAHIVGQIGEQLVEKYQRMEKPPGP